MQTLPVDELVALTELTFIAFDTETTGLSPLQDSLLEVSAVKFRLNEQLQAQVISEFSQLINPRCAIPFGVIKIHGITNEMVDGCPPIESVIPQFLKWLGPNDQVLLAHNASFDLNFLHIALNICNFDLPDHLVLDTLPLSRKILSEPANHRLQTLIEHLDLEAAGYHRALADSYHVMNLFTALINKYRTTQPNKHNPTLIEDLVGMSGGKCFNKQAYEKSRLRKSLAML